MATNTNKLTISGFAEMARSVQTYVSGQLQNINFSGLQDTPLGYLGHSGDYLVVNGGESGINFTGIEKIAQDLTDYGFGNGTFTGLVDTPSTYETGKFIGVTNDGNIEYIDIELLKNIADAPKIEIVSGFLQLNDQRELVWGFPPSPEDNGDVNYAISGATHFTGLLDTPTGYTHNAYIQVDGDSKSLNYVDINKVAADLEDIGAINQPQYFTGLNDTPSEYDNGKFLVSTENGLGFTDIPEPVVAFTGLNDTPAEYDNGKFLVSTENGLGFTDIPEPVVAFTGLSDTPSDFTAGKYLRVNDAGDALEYVDITGVSSGGGGGQIHARFSGSTGAILTKSSNWDTYVDSITFPQGSWNGYLQINYKNDFTTIPTTLATADHRENVPNVHVFAQVQAQSVSSCAIVIADTEKAQVQAEFNVVIFSDEIAGGSSGGGGGNYEFCTAAISGTQYFSNSNAWINFNGSLSTGSTDLTYFVSSVNAYGLRPSTDGYYNINAATKSINSSTNQAASEMHVYVYRHSIDTGSNSLIGYSTEFWQDGGGYNGPQCQVNVPDVYLTTNDVILIRLYGWRNGTNFSIPLETSSQYTYLNLSRADIGGSGSGSTTFTGLSDTPSDFTAGKYLRVNDAGDALEYVDITGVSSGGSNQCGINSLELTNDHPSADSINIAIPDAIIAETSFGNDHIFSLNVLNKNSTDLANNRNLIYTSYGTQYSIDFTNDTNGSYNQSQGIIAAHQQNLKWFIDNGRALYYGSCGSSGGSSSAINKIQENIDNIPLISSGVQIPDAILVKDTSATTTNGADNLIQLDFTLWSNAYDANGNITSQHFSYENDNYATKRWYIRFNSVDGSYISNSEDQHVKKEFNSIQEYISNNRALYFGGGGGGGSAGSDLTDFVSLTDTPVDYIGHSGDYLVVNGNEDGIHFTGIEKIAQDLTDYGFSAGEGGGGSSYFTGLLDTPNDYTNQAGKYVRVSQQEDGLDFIASSELLGLGTVDGYDFCADFHLQSDTTNNSSSFQDLSYDPYSVGSQNVIHSTSITPIYGSSSLYFNGDARLSVGDNSTFSTLSKKLINNYTVQFWINPAIGSQNQPIMGTAGQNTDHGFRILLRSDNKVQFDVFKGLTNDTSVTLISSSAININSWTHVALINSDNVLTFYINGTSSGSINWTKEGTNITPTYPLLIGGLPLDNVDISYLDGYMQDIRIDRTAFNTQYFPPEELTVSQCNANQSELTFSSLKDTPVNYSNAGGKYVRVSENESQLEYVGITVAGSTNNEFSNSFLTQNVTQDEVINELSYGGLDVGKTYRLSTTLCLNADGASDFPKVDFYNGDRKVISLFSKGSTSTVSNSMLFIARDENIFASGRNLSATAYVMGNPEISFMQLELPPSIAVELDEEVILPPSTGAGGIFSIADIKSNAIIEDKDNLLDFSQIVEDLNEEIGGPTGVMLIGDIKLNTIIEKGYELGGSQELFTGVQVDENGDPVGILKIADIKANAIIHQDHDVESNFTGEMPLFSVLNIGDMKTLSTIQQTGIGDNQTVDFPTGAFDWQNI